MKSIMLGAVAMASSVAALFFLRFWRQTRDTLFLLFALAFAMDAVTRLALGLGNVSDEDEPFVYVARLITFALIILAIVNKNRGSRPPLIGGRRFPSAKPKSGFQGGHEHRGNNQQ